MTQVCRVCGCTNLSSCEGGCWWIDNDLCSSCVVPQASTGYVTLQFAWGGVFTTRLPEDEPWSLMHLVPEPSRGPILCGINRHASMTSDGRPTPGWSLGGGLSGPGIAVRVCEPCSTVRDRTLQIHGLNADAFAEAAHAS